MLEYIRIMKLNFIPFLIFLVWVLASCGSIENVVYLQDVEPLKKMPITEKFEMKIQTDDLIAIMVNSQEPELALPFNMPMISYQVGSLSVAQQRVLGYLVDTNGNIDFPVLGTLKVAGLTRMQLTQLIKDRLIEEEQIKDPVVTIQFLNFKVSVIGEVSRPGDFTIHSDRLTLLEALSMAGDLTIYGRRDRVAVMREQNGERIVLFHDLRSSDIFHSPCYYLQQNDIVYVEPNKARAGQSEINQNNSVSVWLSGISILTSVAALIVNLTK